MFKILLQGLLEAFPLSSSLFFSIFKIQNVEIMHLGTGIAFFAFYYSEKYLEFHKHFSKITKLILVLIVPTSVIGLILKKQAIIINPHINNILLASLMFFINKLKKETKQFINLTINESIMISLLIIFALFPGTSRMGLTFTILRIFSVSKKDSFFYSLLIGVPLTISAALLNIQESTQIEILESIFAGIITFFTLFLTKKMINYWNLYSLIRIFFSLIFLLIHL